MFNYLAFIHHGIEKAGEDAYADGRTLASECFAQLQALDNPEQFPPRLLILLASSAYIETARAQSLLDGVYSVCHEQNHKNLPLIGSSVSAVFFDRRVHERGALLVCLASHLLEAEIAVGEDARRSPETAIETMLENLNLNSSIQNKDLNPLGNRLLFTFFPAFGEPDAGQYYPGPDLHEALQKQTHARVTVVGGGSSANDRSRAGLQFAGRQVYVDAIVAARLTTGLPFTASIGHGLTQTGDVYHIDELDDDKRTILKLKQGVPAEVMGLTEEEDFRLLGELSLDRDPLITIARNVPDQPGAARLLRELQPNSSLERLRPEPDRMRREAANLVDWSVRRFRVEHPIGVIGIHCTSWRKFGPDVKLLIDDVQDITGMDGRNYVGGFFDGEIGIGQAGRSLFGNWCVSRLLFGDEMSARALFYSGLDAMAKLSQELARVNSLEDAIKHSLDLICQTGYPGAMLSLLLWNENDQWLVPMQAKGSRYERIVRDCREQAKRLVSRDDLFAKIARDEAHSLIPDTQLHPGREFDGFRGLNLHSQYIKPIRNFEGKSLGFLQIDLGDRRYNQQLQEEELRVIDSLSVVVESTLMRLTNRMEYQIARHLDAALVECLQVPRLSQALRRYIEKAVEIFGAEMGHIRLARYEDRKLVLVAGTGRFYEAQRHVRELLDMESPSPTAQAFKRNKPLVINDVRHSPSFQELLKEYAQQPKLAEALAEIGSYANVVFNDEHGKPMGTINLLTREPWFFTRPLVKSLSAVGRRVSLLVEHYRRQNHQRFLSQVSTVYEYTEDRENSPLDTLRDTVRRCREAANADIACLFLWDAEVEKFVLYAQDGWDQRWVKAASYGPEDRWTGQIALEQGPLYIPDMYRFKQKQGSAHLLRYSKLMFGSYFSENFNVESLVLPLRLKGKGAADTGPNIFSHFPLLLDEPRRLSRTKDIGNKTPLGVFTLYRKLKPEQAGMGESFAVTDPSILKSATDSLAIMVSGQRHREDSRWERDDEKRRNQLRAALSRADKGGVLEETLCKECLKEFSAHQACFYIWNQETDFLTLAAGFEATDKTGRATKRIPERRQDELLLLAAREKKPQMKKLILAEEAHLNPELARQEGAIERICLPLINAKKLLGVLDIRWHRDHLPERQMIKFPWLLRLEKTLSETYFRQKNWIKQQQVKQQSERNRMAAQTMGVMLFQSTHRLMNLVQSLQAQPRLIAAAASPEERERRLKRLADLINSATDKIEQPMQIARRTRIIEPSKNNLLRLVTRALQGMSGVSPVEVKFNIDDKVTVWADPLLIEEAFVNIMHNAFSAMPNGGALEIQTRLLARQNAVLTIFTDTGPGMTPEEIEAVKMGFKSNRNSTGMGILASSLLVAANNGKLDIKSTPGAGTQVFVTLPGALIEEGL